MVPTDLVRAFLSHLQPHLTVRLFLPAVVVGREDLGPFMVNMSTGALWGWEQIRREPEMPLTSLLSSPELTGREVGPNDLRLLPAQK